MATRAEAWLDSLPLPAHREVLRRLLAQLEADQRFRFLELSCSVARGAGDELSDLDLGMGVADSAWPAALADIPAMLRRLGDLVDVLDHEIEGWGERPHRRFFAQYGNGVQVDLVALPAAGRPGMPTGSIALYDPDGRLIMPLRPKSEQAGAEEVREWAFLAWVALADLDKYLHRASYWEALERLNQARAHAWRLWAVARNIRFPVFGLTSVLDEPTPRLPRGIDHTVAMLDPLELRAAAVALGALLITVSGDAAAATGARLPNTLAGYVMNRLRTGS